MAVIDTSSPAYITKLEELTSLYDLFKTLYGPVVTRMTKAQLIQLHNADPIFAKFVEIARDVNTLAERVDIEL